MLHLLSELSARPVGRARVPGGTRQGGGIRWQDRSVRSPSPSLPAATPPTLAGAVPGVRCAALGLPHPGCSAPPSTPARALQPLGPNPRAVCRMRLISTEPAPRVCTHTHAPTLATPPPSTGKERGKGDTGGKRALGAKVRSLHLSGLRAASSSAEARERIAHIQGASGG